MTARPSSPTRQMMLTAATAPRIVDQIEKGRWKQIPGALRTGVTHTELRLQSCKAPWQNNNVKMNKPTVETNGIVAAAM